MPKILNQEVSSSVLQGGALGYAGECCARAAAALSGLIVANANSERKHMPNVDLVAMAPGSDRSVNLSVKTSRFNRRGGLWVQVCRADKSLPVPDAFLNSKPGPRAAFFVLVGINERDFRVWVIPARKLEQAIVAKEREQRGKRGRGNQHWIALDASPTPGRTGLHDARRWRRYENAWHQLGGSRK